MVDILLIEIPECHTQSHGRKSQMKRKYPLYGEFKLKITSQKMAFVA